VCTISWLLLVALVGTAGLTSAAADAPAAKIGDFLKYANGTTLDIRTNLMWMTQDFRNLEGRAPASWDEAMAWAEKMNQQRYGGYSDWRVPTEAEYKTLYDPRRSKMSYASSLSATRKLLRMAGESGSGQVRNSSARPGGVNLRSKFVVAES